LLLPVAELSNLAFQLLGALIGLLLQGLIPLTLPDQLIMQLVVLCAEPAAVLTHNIKLHQGQPQQTSTHGYAGRHVIILTVPWK
jgi:hypothetical protein